MAVHNSPEIQKFLDTAMEDSRQSAGVCDVPSFEEFWAEKYSADDKAFARGQFLGDVSMLIAHNQVTYYKELSSFRRGISAIVLPLKKVIRKLVAFLFLPVVAEQNEINLSIVRVFEDIRCYINKQEETRGVSPRELELTMKLNRQNDAVADLTRQVELLTQRISELESAAKGESDK